MSAQGLQRTQQLLQVIGQQLPSIAQASEMGVDLFKFIPGVFLRSGVQIDAQSTQFLHALTELIGPPTVMPTGNRGQAVDDEPLVNS